MLFRVANIPYSKKKMSDNLKKLSDKELTAIKSKVMINNNI